MDKSYYKLTELGKLREDIAKASYENLMQQIFHTKISWWRKWEDFSDKDKEPHYKFADKMLEIIKPLLNNSISKSILDDPIHGDKNLPNPAHNGE